MTRPLVFAGLAVIFRMAARLGNFKERLSSLLCQCSLIGESEIIDCLFQRTDLIEGNHIQSDERPRQSLSPRGPSL